MVFLTKLVNGWLQNLIPFQHEVNGAGKVRAILEKVVQGYHTLRKTEAFNSPNCFSEITNISSVYKSRCVKLQISVTKKAAPNWAAFAGFNKLIVI